MPPLILVIAGIVALIVVVVLVQRWQAAERRRMLADWAQGRGWTFLGTATDTMPEMQRRFAALAAGRQRYAFNIARGRWRERDGEAFDWRWVTGGGKERRVHCMSAVLVGSRLPLKPLLIRPETFLDQLADLVGFHDIDFESAEFSRRFFVQAEDRRWAYDVIQPATMEYLLSAWPFSLAMSGTWMLVWDGRRWDGAGRERALDHACAVLERLPDFLARQQQGA